MPDRFTIDDVTLLLLSELSPELPADKKSKGKLCVPLPARGLSQRSPRVLFFSFCILIVINVDHGFSDPKYMLIFAKTRRLP